MIKSWKKFSKFFLIASLVAIFAFLYCYKAIGLGLVNTDMYSHDQSAYMDYAKNMHKAKYSYIGGRNRMPVYPFLQSFLYQPGMSDQEFFTQGKYFNVFLSLLLLFCLYLIFQKYLSLLYLVNITLIASFAVFASKAAYFQAELLFYFLNFCSFLLMCKMLKKPTWKLAIITGIVIGITHLTKASILPALILFLLFSTFKMFFSKSRLISQLINIVLVALAFLVIVYPYISTSKRVFGSYFYNVNSTFYMWYDSWDEAVEGTRAHGDRIGWPNMPKKLIPGPKKYLKQHSAKQVLNRLWKGLLYLNSLCKQNSYYKYVLIYSLLFLLITISNLRQYIRLAKKHFFLLFFGLLYFISYLLLYAWYVPIAPGDRLILSQFVPYMFSISYVLSLTISKNKAAKL